VLVPQQNLPRLHNNQDCSAEHAGRFYALTPPTFLFHYDKQANVSELYHFFEHASFQVM